jgi:hypothetical protein
LDIRKATLTHLNQDKSDGLYIALEVQVPLTWMDHA